MKHLPVIALSMLFAPLLHAVGNIVVEDLATLHDQGFVFDIVEHHSDTEVVTIRYRVPEEFNFTGAMGTKPFQGVSFYEPTNKAVREARLIAASGTRFNLLVEKQNKKFHGRLSLIKEDAKNKYLEFHFNQGSGYPPMIIYIPLKLLVDLQKPAKQNKTAHTNPLPRFESKF